MKLEFLRLPAAERGAYFSEAAARRGVSPIILEKDFWVCWMLGILFESPFASDIVFKGGTSLSKVFGVIDRFSEDIDLSLSPEFLELPEIGTPPSRNKANEWMEKAEAACAAAVRDRLQPTLEESVTEVLGESTSAWLEFQIDSISNSPVLLFHYPTTQPAGFAYLRRSVKLEFGSLTDQRPTGRHSVKPWLAEIFPVAFPDWECEVVALEIERTFWEKATILHAEHFRPAEKSTSERFSRHYADTAALASHASGLSAIEQAEARERVVRWKSQFFGSAWARYDLAVPGSFQLLPSQDRIRELERDYEAMKDMYLTEPSSFTDVSATLQHLADRINGKT
ncbi:nucleotidyl transferase AbiEii/AbiGii toxin family protein [Candidatus Laterigemmans baculatus]|uniref:nucleotidyl transferase AbiEii/AbiGii toxin family protein n=1 Tax=Candidatus Laterigemmans baculatus TaxID=2770505 RepID=UPI0013DA7763|nr:nucleotidyl transferase AbiEii/AbiGii toxin family protein [Candidatus Laterigemmans baculatus]